MGYNTLSAGRFYFYLSIYLSIGLQCRILTSISHYKNGFDTVCLSLEKRLSLRGLPASVLK